MKLWDILANVFSSKNDTERIKILEELVKTVQSENDNLAKEFEENRKKLHNFDLVSAALKADPVDNSFIKEFSSLIENDYKKDFCNVERGSNDAENLRKLDDILKEMKLIASCPELHSKSIGAIGGGFSSGKSSVINSFFADTKVKLAEGIKPVTAIPSYVICDRKSQVNGISFNNGRFPISLDMYKEISHEFMISFDFDLKKIIKYTTVLAPMQREELYFEHLCFIDTPGYNPPDFENTGHDFETARKYIEKAEFLIWTVGLDTNGTIPQSDIDFLKKLNVFGINPERHLYVVANKAQLRTPDDIESILDNFEGILDESELSYAGISAYNSKKKEVHAHRKCDLFEFIEAHNKPNRKYAELKGMLDDVFRNYFKKANDDFDAKEEKRKEVKKLLVHNIDIDDSELSVELEGGLNSLLQYFQPEVQIDERLKNIQNLRDKFMKCLNGFCDKVKIERIEDRFCKNCGGPVDNDSKLCSKCTSKTSSNGKVCPDCGKKLAEKAKFCTECGKDL